VSLLINSDIATMKRLKTDLDAWRTAIAANIRLLKDNSDKIKTNLLNASEEGVWLGQSTKSGDLKTMGSRHLTLDVGIADIMAFDNSNKYTHIPKLFFGLNYYFVSINPSAPWPMIPDPQPQQPDGYSHSLESRYSFLQRFSITGGFTLGAMQNPDFDNVYNSFSFTLGPSYRIGKIIKVSLGVAFLKRFDTDPFVTHSSLIMGDYVSISLDYNLLTPVTNLTSMIFK
jgi:hypothetical protein